MRTVVTISDDLDAATAVLEQAGIPHWKLLPITTWATLAGVTPPAVWRRRTESLPTDGFMSRFRDAIARQAMGEPFQYVVGRAAFRTLDLVVDRRVILPRGASDGLVDQVLTHAGGVATGDSWGVVAEIGTGSGAVALSLAVEGHFSRVIATDVSHEALVVAETNRAAVSPRTPVELRLGSWFEPLEGQVFDLIVANPPCVASDDWDGLLPEVRGFEPRVAFDGGPDGLTPARTLIGNAARYLVPGGLVILEIAPGSGDAILKMARASGWTNALVEEDPGRGGRAGRGLYFRAVR